MSDAPQRTAYRMLSEYLEQPELLVPPEPVLNKIAYEGRVTLLAAPEKAGKSTLIGQGAAAVSKGDAFLGRECRQGSVVWLGIDEPLGDAVRRFHQLGAREGVVMFCDAPPLEEWSAILDELRPRLVVIDTLLEYATPYVEDPYKPTDWIPFLKVLRGAADSSGAAFVLLHHTVRNGNRYADSRQIGAGVDVIATMSEPSADPAARKLEIKGRLGREDFTVHYEAGRYTLLGGELPLDMRVLLAVQATPGISTRKLREAVSGSSQAIGASLRELEYRHAIQNRGNGAASAWFAKKAGTTPEPPPEPLNLQALTPYGPTTEPLGTTLENRGVVPAPYRGVENHHSPPALEEVA